MANAVEALNSARSYLNDTGKSFWTDARLLPYLTEAYRDLLLILHSNGLPVLREKSSAITVAIGATSLTLPSDFVEPIKLKERLSGSSDTYVPMEEKDFAPDFDQVENLRYWAFREGAIEFIGATTARQVLLFYQKSLTIPTSAASALTFLYAETFLGPQTAGYAAGALGNTTLAEALLYRVGKDEDVSIAGSKLDTLIRFNVKGQQNLPARRLPYRRTRRIRSLSM